MWSAVELSAFPVLTYKCDHVFWILCLLRPFDRCHIAQPTKFIRRECLVEGLEWPIFSTPLQRIDELLLRFRQIVHIRAEEFLEDNERRVVRRLT